MARWMSYWKFLDKQYLGFRNGPVPLTGRSHYNTGSYYRAAKIFQEKRSSVSKEHYPYIRPNRRCANLPDPWDGIQRSDIKNRRSWKKRKQRKQWM